MIRAPDPETVHQRLGEVLRRIPAAYGLDPKRDVQVLTPMHRGDLGTAAINRALQQRLNPSSGGPELVRGVARAAGVWSPRRVAEGLGMGRSTIQEWIARAARSTAIARADAEPTPWFDDAEIAAITRCVVALDAVERDARHRVLNYLAERYFGRAKVKP